MSEDDVLGLKYEPNYKGSCQAVDVLDHGFVALHNLAGPTRRATPMIDGHPEFPYVIEKFDANDIDPAQCARMSFEQFGSNRTYEEDMKLNEYLLVNEHTSPFEMIQVWLEIKVPIFIDRHMVRHRTWSRNESSGRYITLPAEWYIPEVVGGKAQNKKQGQSDNLTHGLQEAFKDSLGMHCAQGYELYQAAIKNGVAPEHARMFLGVNHYVHWIGNVDLANLFRFMRLRTHSHAQIEAQKYAEAIVTLLRPHLPGLMGLFDRHVRKP